MKTSFDISNYLYPDMIPGEVRRFNQGRNTTPEPCPFCGESTTGFVVIRKKFGWYLYCHRCSTSKMVLEKGLSFSSIRKMLSQRFKQQDTEQQSVDVRTVCLPSDFTTDIPDIGLRWLRRYRVTDDEIQKYRIGYSLRYDRVILPVFNDSGVMYWQGRRLNNDMTQPKYLNFTSSRTEVFFVVNNESPVTVIVEDILSALAVARSGYNTIALLGSHANDRIRTWIPESTRRIKVWLDPDMRKKATTLAKRLRSYGYTASAILLSVKDPKEYQPDEVCSFVGS